MSTGDIGFESAAPRPSCRGVSMRFLCLILMVIARIANSTARAIYQNSQVLPFFEWGTLPSIVIFRMFERSLAMKL